MSVAYPQLSVFTDVYLFNLLVTNPTANTFPMGFNGAAIGNGVAGVNTTFEDVTRAQLVTEISIRIAKHKQSGVVFNNILVDNAAVIGAYSAVAMPGGQESLTYPALPTVGGPNPCQLLTQIK